MLQKDIKKTLIETKERKEKLLIEAKIVKNRLMMIFETKENVKNFHLLPESKRKKMAKALFEEIAYLDEQGLLNEQLWDFLGKIFGNSLGAATETIIEPLINSVLGAIGLGDSYFGKFIVSFITTKPARLAEALKSCDALTKLIAESLGEAVVMMIQQQKGLEGKGYTFLRNALLGAIKDSSFAEKLESQLSSIVCEVFGKMNDKASGVYDKLKTSITSGDIGGLVNANK
jgi:REP element-mobilizing transposase RayT